jgi:hypothetical protein
METTHRPADISRRNFAGLALATAGMSLWQFRASAAEEPKADTLCLMCIDYRFVQRAIHFFDRMVPHVPGKPEEKTYDLVALAGASLAGKQTTRFPNEAPGFWEQVTAATALHPKIKRVIVLDHRECGAYREVFGPQTGQVELDQHIAVMREILPMFRTRGLSTESYLMNMNGSITPMVHG